MKVTKKSGEKGITGIAVVKTGDKGFTFVMKSGDHEGEKYPFKVKDMPDNLPEDFILENGKEYFVSLNADADEIRAIRPSRGFHVVRCTDLARTQDEDFLIIERTGEYGKYYQFVSQLAIQGGKYDGIIVPLYLPMGGDGEDKKKMQDDGDGNITLVGSLEKSRAFSQLYDFWVYALGEETDVAYDEDDQELLGNLLRAVLKKKQKFGVTLDGGYVKSLSALDDVVEDADDDVSDDEEEKAPKKSSKSKKPVDNDDEEEEDLRE